MGDLPEPKYQPNAMDIKENVPVMSKIYETLGRSYAKNKKDLEELHGTYVSSQKYLYNSVLSSYNFIILNIFFKFL